MITNRTTAFVLGGATILAWMIFWNGLLRGWASNHPDSTTSDATLKLIG